MDLHLIDVLEQLNDEKKHADSDVGRARLPHQAHHQQDAHPYVGHIVDGIDARSLLVDQMPSV